MGGTAGMNDILSHYEWGRFFVFMCRKIQKG